MKITLNGISLEIEMYEAVDNMSDEEIDELADALCRDKRFSAKLIELLTDEYYSQSSDVDLLEAATILAKGMGEATSNCISNLRSSLRSADDSRSRAWKKAWRFESLLDRFYQMERSDEWPWYQERKKADMGKLSGRFV